LIYLRNIRKKIIVKIIQLNEFVKLHDGKKIFYSKYEHLSEACGDIEKKGTDAVLIVGGSDRCIYNHHLDIVPKNVKKAFFLNCHIDRDLWGDFVVPIPLGIEITETVRLGPHAWCQGFPEGLEKKEILSKAPTAVPNNLLYANFRLRTNPIHRAQIMEIAMKAPHITWRQPYGESDYQRYNAGDPYISFVNEILDHEAVVCAQGNDEGDNLRIYETLYLSRVPLTFNPKMYENLHSLFPTVLINDPSQLYDKSYLKHEINLAKNRMAASKKYLDFDYWKEMILEAGRL